MTIECYYNECPNHSCNKSPENEGPFCFMENCVATKEDLEIFEKARAKFLESIKLNKK